jgi:NSS family neurotransmitter:Na+ symporter
MIIPAVFAFSGGDESALGQGPGLMFVTLPKIFDSMPAGNFIGAAFFIMVFFAALTSAISLMETIVSIVKDKTGLGRIPCCLIVLGICLLLGLPSSLGYSVWSNFKILGMQILDFFDFISNSVLMPLVALVTCVFVGYVLKPGILMDEVSLSGKFKKKKLFSVMICYIAPIFLLLILGSSVLSAFGVIEF